MYGDKPAPDAVKVEETRPDIKKGGIGGTTPREQEALKEFWKRAPAARKRTGQGNGGGAGAQECGGRARRGQGAPGSERIGTAGGASRLSETYFDRQRKLEEAVEKARRELDAARSGK